MGSEQLRVKIARMEQDRTIDAPAVEDMSRNSSISTGKSYDMSRACLIWGLPRTTVSGKGSSQKDHAA